MQEGTPNIRLAGDKDFAQLAEMKWQRAAEDDMVYGEDNTVGVDKSKFIDEYISFLSNDSTYKIFVVEQDNVVMEFVL